MYCCHLEGCLVFYLFIFLFISLGDFGWVKIKTTLFPIRLCNIVIFLLPPPSLLTCQFLIISLYTLLATTDHQPLVYPRKPGEIDAVTNILQGEFLSFPHYHAPNWSSLSFLLPVCLRISSNYTLRAVKALTVYHKEEVRFHYYRVIWEFCFWGRRMDGKTFPSVLFEASMSLGCQC